MTPRASSGRERIAWARVRTRLGVFLCATTEHGAMWISLRERGARERMEDFLERRVPGARLVRDDRELEPIARELRAYADGELERFSMPLDLRGTEFQLAVWRELRRIPFGRTRSYGEVARRLGSPGASRAVGAANGANPLPLVVP